MKKIIKIILIAIILFSVTLLIESYANVNLNENLKIVEYEGGPVEMMSPNRIIRGIIPILNSFVIILGIIFFIIGLVKIYKYKEWKVMRRLVIIMIIYFVITAILQLVFDGWAVNIPY